MPTAHYGIRIVGRQQENNSNKQQQVWQFITTRSNEIPSNWPGKQLERAIQWLTSGKNSLRVTDTITVFSLDEEQTTHNNHCAWKQDYTTTISNLIPS